MAGADPIPPAMPRKEASGLTHAGADKAPILTAYFGVSGMTIFRGCAEYPSTDNTRPRHTADWRLLPHSVTGGFIAGCPPAVARVVLLAAAAGIPVS